MNIHSVLQVNNLNKTYKRGEQLISAVKDLSFELGEGEILGILGPNGSGKTTTVKSIATIVEYDSGSIQLLGKDNREHRLWVLSKMGAVLEGARNIYWTLTAEENCFYFAGLHGLSRKQIKGHLDEMFLSLDLNRYRTRLVNELSKGNQQKVAICCALIAQPQVVLLDEPTLGLDVETTQHMKVWLKNWVKIHRTSILVTSHDMEFIESICDRVLIVKEGRLVTSGSILDLRASFSKRSVELVLRQPLNDIQEQMLKQKQISYRSSVANGQFIVKLILPCANCLYHIFEVLNIQRQEILSVNINESDLEEIFLSIIRDSERTFP